MLKSNTGSATAALVLSLLLALPCSTQASERFSCYPSAERSSRGRFSNPITNSKGTVDYVRKGRDCELVLTYDSGNGYAVVLLDGRLYGFAKDTPESQYRLNGSNAVNAYTEQEFRNQIPSVGGFCFELLMYADPEFFMFENIFDGRQEFVKEMKSTTLPGGETFVRRFDVEMSDKKHRCSLYVDSQGQLVKVEGFLGQSRIVEYRFIKEASVLKRFEEWRPTRGLSMFRETSFEVWKAECSKEISLQPFGLSKNRFVLPAFLVVLALGASAYVFLLSRGMKAKLRKNRNGVTLVEVLVVTAVLTTLLAITIPAVQQARESARMMSCESKVRQQSLAILAFEAKHKEYPSCGWGYGWGGLSDLGFNKEQPGGWMFRILPEIEQENFFQSHPTSSDLESQNLQPFVEAARRRISHFHCPSKLDRSQDFRANVNMVYGTIAYCEKPDYAMNAGPSRNETHWFGPSSFKDGIGITPLRRQETWDGIARRIVGTRQAQVVDGTANTLLVGEKRISFLDHNSDNQPYDTGCCTDNLRWTNVLESDHGSVHIRNPQFGGPHHGITVFSKCDGSTSKISNSIDSAVLRSLGAIHDGAVVNVDQ